ncbi:MAG: hypothetical protein LBF36_04040 [Mycoplasmataceae bacterium]|jgi:hypothetical protein|nr:hypothetical protein [Mycoplasmataceae bacterium]
MAKTKTIKIAAIDPDKFERIDVPKTARVNLSQINLKTNFEDEIINKTYSELEYMLRFEVTDPIKIAKLKARMKELKKK